MVTHCAKELMREPWQDGQICSCKRGRTASLIEDVALFPAFANTLLIPSQRKRSPDGVVSYLSSPIPCIKSCILSMGRELKGVYGSMPSSSKKSFTKLKAEV